MDIENWQLVENWFLLLTSLAALVWPAIMLATWWSYRRCRSLKPELHLDADTKSYASISVVIPARDEEAGIEGSVRSVLAQQGVDLQVIVVNDHSTDRTGEILAGLAAEDDRVTVIDDPPMIDGWLGKANALQHAVGHATGDYILFSDADIDHRPGSFAAAAREIREQGYALLSLMPLYRWEGLWENSMAPAYLLAMTNFLSGSIHDPQSDDAIALGAFILVDSDVYRRLGGHEAVKDMMLDDVGLAKHFKRKGQSTAFYVAPQCLSVRMYDGIRSVFYGCTKNILAVFGGNFWLACPLAVTFAFGALCVLGAPLVGAMLGSKLLLVLGIAVYLEVYVAVLLARAYMKCNLIKLALFVTGMPVLLAAAGLAVYQAAAYGSVLWRGRAIRVN